jgi:polar amino acid transport system permease protein
VTLPPPLDLLPPLLAAVNVTIFLTLTGIAVAIAIAVPAGLARTSRWRWLRLAVALYVEPIRGSSLMVQLFIWFYLLPFVGIRLGALETGVLALGINYGAYGSEIVRAAVVNVDRGQREAAIALNMPSGLAMRRIIFPQAAIAMLPPFGNIVIQMLKATALVSLITITEVTFTAKGLISANGRTREILTLVLLLYFALSLPLMRAVKMLETYATRSVGVGMPQLDRSISRTLPIEAVDARTQRVV